MSVLFYAENGKVHTEYTTDCYKGCMDEKQVYI